MPRDLSIVPSPVTGLYRLAYAFPGPFELRSWENAGPDGTFGNRFDDPALHLPLDERFQVFYCATKRHVTFAETLASLFPSLATLAGMATIQDDESVESVQVGAADPDDTHYGLVRADWRLPRVRVIRFCSQSCSSSIWGLHKPASICGNRSPLKPSRTVQPTSI